MTQEKKKRPQIFATPILSVMHWQTSLPWRWVYSQQGPAMTGNWFLVVFRHKFLLFCELCHPSMGAPLFWSHPLSFDNGGLNSVERAGQSVRGPNVSYQISLFKPFQNSKSQNHFRSVSLTNVAFRRIWLHHDWPHPPSSRKSSSPLCSWWEGKSASGDHLHATHYREPVLQTLFLRDLIQPQKPALQGQPSTVKINCIWTGVEGRVWWKSCFE